RLQTRGDVYVARQISDFPDRASLERCLDALRRVQARHPAWRTLIAWDGLPHPVQVVLREATLPLTEHACAPDTPALTQLQALTDPAHHRLEPTQSPMLHCDVLHDSVQDR